MDYCSVITGDSDWSIDKWLWEIVYLNDPSKTIQELCMAFLSLCWLHEDNSYFDMYDTSLQEHTYNNRIHVGDIVLYYIQQRHSKPPNQEPFVWFKQFKYAISLATTLKRFMEPPLTGDEIRSIYVQSFPHHYCRDIIENGTYPHSSDYMQDIATMTKHFANIYNRELPHHPYLRSTPTPP